MSASLRSGLSGFAYASASSALLYILVWYVDSSSISAHLSLVSFFIGFARIVGCLVLKKKKIGSSLLWFVCVGVLFTSETSPATHRKKAHVTI